jgi:flagellar basal-body rod modification protein FlgD
MSTTAVSPAASNASATSQAASTGTVTSTSGTDDQTMFLQLLVSELQNQDPMNPVQGTDFVTQLAQFQQLEQSISSGQDISAIHSDADQLVADFNSNSSSGSTTGSSAASQP